MPKVQFSINLFKFCSLENGITQKNSMRETGESSAMFTLSCCHTTLGLLNRTLLKFRIGYHNQYFHFRIVSAQLQPVFVSFQSLPFDLAGLVFRKIKVFFINESLRSRLKRLVDKARIKSFDYSKARLLLLEISIFKSY